MKDVLSAALGAILGSLEGGCEVADAPWGVLVSNAEFHRVHMANFLWLLAEPPGGMVTALDRADQAFAPLRVRHRMVIVGESSIAPTVVPDLTGKGFVATENHVMVARRPPEVAANPEVIVRRARDQATRDDYDTIAGLLHEEEGYDYEVSHQLLTLQWRRANALGREAYVAYLRGEPAGVGVLDDVDRVGLIGEVATAPDWRRLGVATTLVRALRERADARGVSIACLETAARDSTRELYGRLGFDSVGSFYELLRE